MVKPILMCRKHLLGEHFEIHKHRHNFVKRHSIKKRVELKQIEPESMGARHDELAKEMLRRGFRHESPYEMPDLSHLSDEHRTTKVDRGSSLVMLRDRCPDCAELISR